MQCHKVKNTLLHCFFCNFAGWVIRKKTCLIISSLNATLFLFFSFLAICRAIVGRYNKGDVDISNYGDKMVLRVMKRMGSVQVHYYGYLYKTTNGKCAGVIPGVMRFTEVTNCTIAWRKEDGSTDTWRRPICRQ